MKIESKPQSVKKFYFLEYFYVLLKSVESYSNQERVFDSFKILKQKHQLGESKYKKLAFEKEKMLRYRYTFEQLTNEAVDYGLITIGENENLFLTEKGEQILLEYEEKRTFEFNRSLFYLMEQKYYAFHYLVNFCYKANKKRSGLLIFPNYSPLKLHFERTDIKTTADIIKYSESLVKKLQEDIKEYLDQTKDLTSQNNNLINRLIKAELLPENKSEHFDDKRYNVLIKRIRDFWLSYFLKDIYGYEYSFSTFDIWTYRGKQVGIIHVTAFYPGFNGIIVYPTSVILNSRASKDFERIFEYSNGDYLYIHRPSWGDERTQEKFVESLTNAYFDIRKSNRSYFVNLADLRELVCYNMKISQQLFDEFLEKAYRLNLVGQLKVNISLEADKLPQETSAMYLKREPVMVDGRYRNIIAIDITRGEKQHGKTIEKTH